MLNHKSGTLCCFVPGKFLNTKELKFWSPGCSVIPVPRLVKYSFLHKMLLFTMTLVLLMLPAFCYIVLFMQSDPKT